MTQVKANRVGEVIEASTTEFTTQCYDLYTAPPLGSLVRVSDDSAIYGIVSEVATRSLDPSRHPIARGADEDTEEAVYLNNPQLSRLLFTEFRAMVVGHRDNDEIKQYLPPLPPRIHAFAYVCGGDELRDFSESMEFLPLLLSAPLASTDDVIASFIRLAAGTRDDSDDFVVESGKRLASHLGGQLQRLNTILRRL